MALACSRLKMEVSKGMFEEDMYDGHGIFKFTSGDVYEGKYCKDVYRDRGVFQVRTR